MAYEPPPDWSDWSINRLMFRIVSIGNFPLHCFHMLLTLGGYYVPHYDLFSKENGQYWSGDEYPGGQRIATFLVYLSDVEDGGETIWPDIDAAVPDSYRLDQDHESHQMGSPGRPLNACGDATRLSVRPRRGQGILFYRWLE